MAVRAALALVLVGASACGDNAEPDILVQLRALPSIADATEMTTAATGYRYIQIHFIQPVDHASPDGPTFLQEASLLHRDQRAPLVVETTGYWDYQLDRTVELTQLFTANQLSIEHRFFGSSRPDPASWGTLTIEQMADDEHAIVSALRTIYDAPLLATGGSKGGMTAMFYRRFFPDDVAGTVPYVAPISFGAPDERYPPYLATIGPVACHAAVQAAAIEMLANRRAAMETRAMAQAAANNQTYTRVALGPAVESAIESVEWSFWQYWGVEYCAVVPPTTATDDAMYAFLDMVSPVNACSDAELALFEAYYYQSDVQLGYPDDGTTYLTPYLMYANADYAGILPIGAPPPAYDGGAAMRDIAQYVASSGDRLLFVYGQWDPWSGGAYTLGSAADSLELVEAQGTHLSDIAHLASSDAATARATLAAWVKAEPTGAPAARYLGQREPHPASGLLHSLHRVLARHGQ
jgi:hypothetical protein